MERGNILFCGVGGQGILLASELTAYSLLSAGADVKKSEVHGMAQRGGSVEAHLRFGPKVYSPLIEMGTVDFLVSFELMEAARYLPYLNKDSKVVVNSQRIFPPPVATGKLPYPDDCLDRLTSQGIEVNQVDGFDLAGEAGNVKAANVVLVGALSAHMNVDSTVFIDVIKTRFPQKIQGLNIKAFEAGRQAMQQR